jgi:A/G-specific adenine glycosylase
MTNPRPGRMFFVHWFRDRGREFPWRNVRISPYKILVTEMLLRQTRASNVSAVWAQFLRRYPNVKSLAKARRKDLVRQLKVLGFGNQRADALISASRWLLHHHNGKVPASLEDLLKIPHVGEYSARAVLCFAYGVKVEIVDSNVLRFVARYYGLRLKPDNRRNPIAWKLAREALPHRVRSVKEHNYGILDFTAEVCKSGRPHCEICPLLQSCADAQAKNLPHNE